MADLIRVDADLALQHASRIENVADRVDVAIDAARSMNMGGGAFGLMCAFLVPPATVVSSVACDVLQSSRQLIERSAQELRAGVADIGECDQRAVDELRVIEANLDGR